VEEVSLLQHNPKKHPLHDNIINLLFSSLLKLTFVVVAAEIKIVIL
jgi:hypothetical protein